MTSKINHAIRRVEITYDIEKTETTLLKLKTKYMWRMRYI